MMPVKMLTKLVSYSILLRTLHHSLLNGLLLSFITSVGQSNNHGQYEMKDID